jgi:superfamily I DNA/RNA helicase
VEPGVKLLTFHAAKGLEFGDVIVVGLYEGIFPPAISHEVALDAGESEQDFLSAERRLLYVAMTRTKRGLYLIAGRPPTRFLSELDTSLYITTAAELASPLVPSAQRA